MNTLSWVLYGYDVLGGLHGVVWFIFMLLVLNIFRVLLFGYVCKFGKNTESEGYPIYKNGIKLLPKMLWLFGVVFILNFLVPSKDTFHLILASEVGEDIYQSEDVQTIKNYLMNKIEEEFDGSEN